MHISIAEKRSYSGVLDVRAGRYWLQRRVGRAVAKCNRVVTETVSWYVAVENTQCIGIPHTITCKVTLHIVMGTESYIGLYRTTGECVLTRYGTKNVHGGTNTHYGKETCIVYVIVTRTITVPWLVWWSPWYLSRFFYLYRPTQFIFKLENYFSRIFYLVGDLNQPSSLVTLLKSTEFKSTKGKSRRPTHRRVFYCELN